MKTNSLPPITKQQKEILFLLYKFRFLNTITIQKLLNHKLPTRIQQWLYDLNRKGYVCQFYDKDTFVGRTIPAVYCLSTKARHILRSKTDNLMFLNSLYREKQRSAQFRDHWLYIATLYLKLAEIYATGDERLRFFTKTELYKYTHFPMPLPDAFFAIEKKDDHIQRYFLELLDDYLPNKAIRFKIKRYITSAEGDWHEKTGVAFPKVIIIVSNKSKQKRMARKIKRVLEEEYSDLVFYLGNKATIEEQGILKNMWERVDTE